ncbi:glycosyltransferase family 2 protein [Enterococcus gilvus]|uniref:glycosyltransferase family 2 protein n=1 Tax=Enterococcus gilvus TaxID=160453 RepID=UPI001C8BFA37|nr:glycosyltransferase family 2 protein [Enterococcus gilvus]MBX8937885.1 glycosyltransferase family 2 protein [Enterococcus gilvus]
MKNGPLISVIMPAFNSSQHIDQAIQSIQRQTYENWELLVIDDCSKDQTVSIVEKFSANDNRINLFVLEKNQGAAVARNTGLENASGKYIAFLDSDDRWLPEKLEKQIEFMEKKNIAFSFTSYEFIRENADFSKKIVHVKNKMTYKDVLKDTRIGTLTVMVNRELTGEFSMPLVRRGQDLLTWISLLKRGFIAYGIDEPLSEYRVVSGSLSNDKLTALKRTWTNYRKHLDLNLFQAGYYFTFYAFNAFKKHYFEKEN